MKTLGKIIEFGSRFVCACLLVGGCMWVAGAVGDVPQAAMAGQYLTWPFLGFLAAYLVLTGVGVVISLPLVIATAAVRWWRGAWPLI